MVTVDRQQPVDRGAGVNRPACGSKPGNPDREGWHPPTGTACRPVLGWETDSAGQLRPSRPPRPPIRVGDQQAVTSDQGLGPLVLPLPPDRPRLDRESHPANARMGDPEGPHPAERLTAPRGSGSKVVTEQPRRPSAWLPPPTTPAPTTATFTAQASILSVYGTKPSTSRGYLPAALVFIGPRPARPTTASLSGGAAWRRDTCRQWWTRWSASRIPARSSCSGASSSSGGRD